MVARKFEVAGPIREERKASLAERHAAMHRRLVAHVSESSGIANGAPDHYPDALYSEDLFRLAGMSNENIKKYLNRKYGDSELEEFMSAVLVTPGSGGGTFDRDASIQLILDKLAELRGECVT